LIRKLITAAGSGLVIAVLSASATAFASDPGAAACQPAAGQLTATIAQSGQLGTIISGIAPINKLNQHSLFHCSQP